MSKLKLARTLRTQQEIIDKVPVFQTVVWEKRKAQISDRLENKIKKNKERKLERLAKLEVEGKPQKKSKKLTIAEQRTLKRKIKRKKFAKKLKSIIN